MENDEPGLKEIIYFTLVTMEKAHPVKRDSKLGVNLSHFLFYLLHQGE